MIYRARVVLPVASPPIEDGAVMVRRGRIAAVGRWGEVLRATRAADVVDLGEVVLLPGLVNAHCHLDYTDMRIVRGRKSFADWAKTIIKTKSGWKVADYRKSWVRGAQMLEESGTTTVADIEAVPELLPWAWKQTRLRVCSFLEMTGVASGRKPAQIVSEALQNLTRLKTSGAIENTGLSPHALYSTVPELLRLISSKKKRVTMHVAESEEEMEMYARRKGKLFEWLMGIRDMSDCGGTTPVGAIARSGLLGPNFLGVHCNYLTDGDISLLARSRSSVVHCPSSHVYFGHRRLPYERLAREGVNVCLGTDSMASMRGCELNMFVEMQQFARVYPKVSSAQALRMATISGARALGMERDIGALKVGAFADFIAVPFSGHIDEAHDCILRVTKPSAVFIDGQRVTRVN